MKKNNLLKTIFVSLLLIVISSHSVVFANTTANVSGEIAWQDPMWTSTGGLTISAFDIVFTQPQGVVRVNGIPQTPVSNTVSDWGIAGASASQTLGVHRQSRWFTCLLLQRCGRSGGD